MSSTSAGHRTRAARRRRSAVAAKYRAAPTRTQAWRSSKARCHERLGHRTRDRASRARRAGRAPPPAPGRSRRPHHALTHQGPGCPAETVERRVQARTVTAAQRVPGSRQTSRARSASRSSSRARDAGTDGHDARDAGACRALVGGRCGRPPPLGAAGGRTRLARSVRLREFGIGYCAEDRVGGLAARGAAAGADHAHADTVAVAAPGERDAVARAASR